jgi:RHS repeat-associated protein
MYALAPHTPAHALPRVSPRAQERSRASGRLWPSATGCKTASKKKFSFSRWIPHARCAPAQTAPRENALFSIASVSGALVLRFPGQYWDSETGLAQNYMREYMASQGRYTQNDPIGLAGGWNRFGYVDGNPLSMTDPLGLMGQGSGGNARGGSRPAAGANASVGGGVSFHLPIGIGLGIDGGIATDTGGNMCFYSMMCYTVGPPGISGSAGGVASVGSGPLTTGVTDYKGVCWSGGAGIAGGGSVLFGNDGSAQVGRGLAGVGGGASVAYQSCKQMLVCRKN